MERFRAFVNRYSESREDSSRKILCMEDLLRDGIKVGLR
jgi:hypothetical protein